MNFQFRTAPHTRDDKEIINSILFDIGCYGLTLLFDFGLSLKHLKLKDLDFKGGELLRLKLSSDQNPNVELIFSIVDKYKNYLKFEKYKNEGFHLSLFYGRKGQRKIVYSNNHKIFDETITFEGNFVICLRLQSNKCGKQETRFSSMYDVTLCLNRLSDEILNQGNSNSLTVKKIWNDRQIL